MDRIWLVESGVQPNQFVGFDPATETYFGRTAMVLEECFKDYEVYLDDAPQPIVRGQFAIPDAAQKPGIDQGLAHHRNDAEQDRHGHVDQVPAYRPCGQFCGRRFHHFLGFAGRETA